jgi:putative endonuclease
MKNQKQYFAYIATNKRNTTLYTGVTNNLYRRMHEHKNSLVEGFSKKYKICKLIFYESFDSAQDAILAEKRIKGWMRQKKINLIKSKNPEFKDLLDD